MVLTAATQQALTIVKPTIQQATMILRPATQQATMILKPITQHVAIRANRNASICAIALEDRPFRRYVRRKRDVRRRAMGVLLSWMKSLYHENLLNAHKDAALCCNLHRIASQNCYILFSHMSTP